MTEYAFTLPRGYVDQAGIVHREGRMRQAIGLDEMESIRDPRVQENEAYLPAMLLSRVITQLGTLQRVTPELIAQLFVADLAYLEDFYQRLNSSTDILVGTVCPHCGQRFQLRVAPFAA